LKGAKPWHQIPFQEVRYSTIESPCITQELTEINCFLSKIPVQYNQFMESEKGINFGTVEEITEISAMRQVTLLILVVLIVLKCNAQSGFVGDMASTNWTLYQDPGSTGTVNFTPTTLTMTSSNGLTFSFYQNLVYLYAPVSGNYSFHWMHTTADNHLYDDASYYLNGFYFSLTESMVQSAASGDVSFYAEAGTMIGFTVFTNDDAYGASTLVISNYTWPVLITGCMDPVACNYNALANDSASCTYALPYLTCLGTCVNDADGDGICDELEVVGCMDPIGCNYLASATDEAECTYPAIEHDCAGNCLDDADGDGVCDAFEVLGCQNPNGCNFEPLATDSGYCQVPAPGFNCNGACLNDSDGDGVCDENEIPGCNIAGSCNYYPYATDPIECTHPQFALDCNGVCLQDTDGDGVCNEFELAGCQDSSACNFDALATDSAACVFAVNGYQCDGTCVADQDGDGVCDALEIVGCSHPGACNYNPLSTDEGTCVFPLWGYDCWGNCLSDLDNDGVCDVNEIVGCTDSLACDFLPQATDSSSCSYPVFGYQCDGSCINDSDGDGICDEFEWAGCMDSLACNYDVLATDSSFCVYPQPELCNGVDDDCNGTPDDGLAMITYYVDNDNDGFGDGFLTTTCLTLGLGAAVLDGDCNDGDVFIHPGADEVLDNDIDEDCDGILGTGISEWNQESVALYPNPSSGEVIIQSMHDIYCQIQVMTLQGQVVREEKMQGKTTFNWSSLASGVYLVVITDEEGSITAMKWEKRD
jgi:hypothetical protein